MGGVLPSSRYARKILGFSGCRGGKNLGFQKSHGGENDLGRRRWPKNFGFSGKITNFGAFQNFTDVRFSTDGTFSISTGVSFGEN